MNLLELTGYCNDNKIRGPHIMVFDWTKCVKIIQEEKLLNVEAFLRNDEMNTSGRILDDGKVVFDHEAILESYNLIPTMRDMDTNEEWECYKSVPVTNWTAQAIISLMGDVDETA